MFPQILTPVRGDPWLCFKVTPAVSERVCWNSFRLLPRSVFAGWSWVLIRAIPFAPGKQLYGDRIMGGTKKQSQHQLQVATLSGLSQSRISVKMDNGNHGNKWNKSKWQTKVYRDPNEAQIGGNLGKAPAWRIYSDWIQDRSPSGSLTENKERSVFEPVSLSLKRSFLLRTPPTKYC